MQLSRNIRMLLLHEETNLFHVQTTPENYLQNRSSSSNMVGIEIWRSLHCCTASSLQLSLKKSTNIWILNYIRLLFAIMYVVVSIVCVSENETIAFWL